MEKNSCSALKSGGQKFRRIISIILSSAVFFQQTGFADIAEKSCLSPTSSFNGLQKAVSDKAGLSGAHAYQDNMDPVLPFVAGVIGDIFRSEAKEGSSLDADAIKAHILSLLINRFGNARSFNLDFDDLFRDKASIVIPVRGSVECYRFFYPAEARQFDKDDIIESFEDVSGISINLLRREKADGTGNIAAGYWPAEAHDALNDMIKDLINTPQDKTAEFEISLPVSDINKSLDALEKNVPPSCSVTFDKLLSLIKPGLTLGSLVNELKDLSQKPGFKCYFLEPRYGDDDFRILYKGKKERPVLLRAHAHFGHHRTEGPAREENIYISGPYYNGLSYSDRLGLIAHEMVHLILGAGDNEHDAAQFVERMTSYAFDTSRGVSDEVRMSVRSYIRAKDDLANAIERDDRTSAHEAYVKIRDNLKVINLSGISENTMAAICFEEIDEITGPVISKLISELSGKSNDPAGILTKFEEILNESGLGGFTTNGILNGLKNAPIREIGDHIDFSGVLLYISQQYAKEISALSGENLPDFMNSLIDEVIEEAVTALYKEKGAQDHWRERIKKDVIPLSFGTYIPEEWLDEKYFEDRKHDVMTLLVQDKVLSGQAVGAHFPSLGMIVVKPTWDKMDLRSTLIHEMVHYLAHKNQIKIGGNYEYPTFAIDLATKVMHARNGNIQEAEKALDTFQQEYVPAFSDLYKMGKSLHQSGKSLHLLKPALGSESGASFDIDLFIIEAIKLYEELRIDTLALRRYLNAKKRTLQTSREKEQFYIDKYSAEQVAGVIMAGIFISEYETNGTHPIKQLADYFAELDKALGAPDAADREWINNWLIPNLKELARQLFVMDVEITPGDSLDRLGLWQTEMIGPNNGIVKYWPFTLYPGDRDNPDRTKARKDAYDRSIGNLLLALYRLEHSTDGKVDSVHAEEFNQPAFRVLWDTLSMPLSIVLGVPRDAERAAKEKSLSKYDRIPGLIRDVLRRKFDLGNKEIEKEFFNSLPFHLQYIDTLLYRWCVYDPDKDANNIPEDPRLDDKSPVREAVSKTYNGWMPIMFKARSLSGHEEIYSLIMENIWDEYMKLFEADKEKEQERETIERMRDKNLLPKQGFDPNDLTPEEKQALKDFFESLPKEIQDAIKKHVEEMMNNAGSGAQNAQDSGSEGGKPQPGGQGMPGKGNGSGGIQGGLEGIEQDIKNLEKTINGMEGLLSKMSRAAGDIGKGTDGIKDRLPEAGGRTGDKQDEAVDAMQDAAKGLQDKAVELGRSGKKLDDKAGKIKKDAFSADGKTPVPGMGESVKDNASELGKRSDDVNKKIDELKDKVNKLKKLVDRLKDLKSKGQDVTQLGQVAGEIKNATDGISGKADAVKDELSRTNETVQELEEAVDQLSRDIESLTNIKAPDAKQDGQPDTGTSGQKGDEAPPDKLSLPEGNITSLNSIVNEAVNETSTPSQIDNGDVSFSTDVDPSWLKAADEDTRYTGMDSEETGLNEEETKEYIGWLDLIGKESFENMIDLIKGFGIPTEDAEKVWSFYQGNMKNVVKAIMGQPYRTVQVPVNPRPVKISIIFDISGSMNVQRMNYARAMLVLILEAIYDVNDALIKGNHEPIQFEVGFFDTNIDPFFDNKKCYETGENRKRRLIYDAVKSLKAGGGTREADALGNFVTRLKNKETPMGSEEEARRILFFVGDGDGYNKANVGKAVKYAGKDKKVDVFGFSVGDNLSKTNIRNVFGKRAVISDKDDLSDLPLKAGACFAECLTPPSADISWQMIISRMASVLLAVTGYPILNEILRAAAGVVFKIKSSGEKSPELRPTGYRNFFYQEINGRDYLVFKRTDMKGAVHEYRWQRGAGGAYVPPTVTIDDDDNEKIILDMITLLHDKPGTEYTSYSGDGKYYLRASDARNKEFVLMEREFERDDEEISQKEQWTEKKKFGIKAGLPEGRTEGGYKVFEADGVTWRLDSIGSNLYIKSGPDTWTPVIGSYNGFGEHTIVEYSSEDNEYIVFDQDAKRSLVCKLDPSEAPARIICDLKMESFTKHEDWEGKIVRLIGETGLGKDELVRAAAHLMNEEVFYISGNMDVQPEELIAYQTIGVEEKLTSSYLYSAVNQVLQNGGWVIIDEINKVNPGTLNIPKSSVANKKHPRFIKVNGRKKRVMIPNHPRARIIGTANTMREGVAQAQPVGPAMQERITDYPFTWRDPNSEKKLQYELGVRKLEKYYRGVSKEDMDKKKKKLMSDVNKLVDIAWPMRLQFAGYSNAQRAKLIEHNFSNWTKLLQDPTFKPASKAGSKLKRAPSPRVLANIIDYSMLYPKTWEHMPLSSCMLWYNFWVDNMKPGERLTKQNAIMTQFERPKQGGGQGGFTDSTNIPPVILKENSFVIDGEYLIVKPEPVEVDGKKTEYWDNIRVWIHEDSRIEIKEHGLPESLLFWLGTGSLSNMRQLYLALQFRAQGKSIIFTGDPSSGKSLLAGIVCELLGGPDYPETEISRVTEKEDLTFKQQTETGVSYFEEGPIATALREKKTALLEESTQGRPKVFGVLNEVVERQIMAAPDGTIIGNEGDGRAGIIHAVNPPGEGDSDVYAFSDEFIERHPVMRFEPLPYEEVYDYFLTIKGNNGEIVNPRLIGDIRRNSSGAPVLMADGAKKWDGLLGVIQDIQLKKKKTPLDKRIPNRVPSFRTMKNLLRRMLSYWDLDTAPMYSQDVSAQETLFGKFCTFFTQLGTAEEVATRYGEVKKSFIAARIFKEDSYTEPTDPKDKTQFSLDEFLNGESVIVQKLPVLRTPDTKEYAMDRALIFIQENTKGIAVSSKIEEIYERIAAYKNSWDSLSLNKKVAALHIMREVWQILDKLVIERGSGDKADSYSMHDISEMKKVQLAVKTHMADIKWPMSFIKRVEVYDDLMKRTEDLKSAAEKTGVYTYRIACNAEDEEFLKAVTAETEVFVKGLDMRKPLLHESAESIRDAYLIYSDIKILSAKYPGNNVISGLFEMLLSEINAGPMSLSEIEDDTRIGSIEAIINNIPASLPDFVDPGKTDVTREDTEVLKKFLKSENLSIFELYRGVCISAVRSLKNDVAKDVLIASKLYKAWLLFDMPSITDKRRSLKKILRKREEPQQEKPEIFGGKEHLEFYMDEKNNGDYVMTAKQVEQHPSRYSYFIRFEKGTSTSEEPSESILKKDLGLSDDYAGDLEFEWDGENRLYILTSDSPKVFVRKYDTEKKIVENIGAISRKEYRDLQVRRGSALESGGVYFILYADKNGMLIEKLEGGAARVRLSDAFMQYPELLTNPVVALYLNRINTLFMELKDGKVLVSSPDTEPPYAYSPRDEWTCDKLYSVKKDPTNGLKAISHVRPLVRKYKDMSFYHGAIAFGNRIIQAKEPSTDSTGTKVTIEIKDKQGSLPSNPSTYLFANLPGQFSKVSCEWDKFGNLYVLADEKVFVFKLNFADTKKIELAYTMSRNEYRDYQVDCGQAIAVPFGQPNGPVYYIVLYGNDHSFGWDDRSIPGKTSSGICLFNEGSVPAINKAVAVYALQSGNFYIKSKTGEIASFLFDPASATDIGKVRYGGQVDREIFDREVMPLVQFSSAVKSEEAEASKDDTLQGGSAKQLPGDQSETDAINIRIGETKAKIAILEKGVEQLEKEIIETDKGAIDVAAGMLMMLTVNTDSTVSAYGFDGRSYDDVNELINSSKKVISPICAAIYEPKTFERKALMFVANRDGSVPFFDFNGKYIGQVNAMPGHGAVADICVSGDGELYILYTDGYVFISPMFDADKKPYVEIAQKITAYLDRRSPNRLAVDRNNGTVYVLCGNGRHIEVFNNDGDHNEDLSELIRSSVRVLASPSDIDVNADGDLLIAEKVAGCVTTISVSKKIQQGGQVKTLNTQIEYLESMKETLAALAEAQEAAAAILDDNEDTGTGKLADGIEKAYDFILRSEGNVKDFYESLILVDQRTGRDGKTLVAASVNATGTDSYLLRVNYEHNDGTRDVIFNKLVFSSRPDLLLWDKDCNLYAVFKQGDIRVFGFEKGTDEFADKGTILRTTLRKALIKNKFWLTDKGFDVCLSNDFGRSFYILLPNGSIENYNVGTVSRIFVDDKMTVYAERSSGDVHCLKIKPMNGTYVVDWSISQNRIEDILPQLKIVASTEPGLPETVSESHAVKDESDVIATVRGIPEELSAEISILKSLLAVTYKLYENSGENQNMTEEESQSLSLERAGILEKLKILRENNMMEPIPSDLLMSLWIYGTIQNNVYLTEPLAKLAEYAAQNADLLKAGLALVPDGVASIIQKALEGVLNSEKQEKAFPAYLTPEVERELEKSMNLESKGAAIPFEQAAEPKCMIFYADSLIDNAILYDLEPSFKKYFDEKNILNGGKVILFSKDKTKEAEVERLGAFIKTAAPKIGVMIINAWEYGEEFSFDEKMTGREIEKIIAHANAKREEAEGTPHLRAGHQANIRISDIIGVIKTSPGKDIAELRLNYKLDIPLVLINNNERGLFSFAQALELIARMLHNDPLFSGNIQFLDRLMPLTDDMYKAYRRYMDEVLTKA